MNQTTSPKKRRKWPIVVIALVILLAGGVLLAGNLARNNLAGRLSLLTTVPVTREDLAATVYGSGILSAETTATLYAAADAQVGSLAVAIGDNVKQGDQLAVLSSETLDDKLVQLETSISTLDMQISQLRSTAGSDHITAPVAGRIKVLYAEEDWPVQAIMDEYNALCIISADGWLSVDLQDIADSVVGLPGDSVTVTAGELTEDGKILSRQDGRMTVVFPDDQMAVGVLAAVAGESGNLIGTAPVAIHKPVYVTGDIGTVKTVRKEVNDKVSKGNWLFTLSDAAYSAEYLDLIDQRQEALADLQAARLQRESLVILAPMDGIVSELAVKEKGIVQENQMVCVLEGTGSYQMEVMIDELDISRITTGQTAEVSLAAFAYQTFTASVQRISAVGTTTGGVTTYPVLLRLQPAEGLFSGMSASADILVGTREAVLTVPLNALKVDGDRIYVTVVRTGADKRQTTEDITVTVGLVNGSRAEILTGLSEGETIQTVDAAAEASTGFGMGLR